MTLLGFTVRRMCGGPCGPRRGGAFVRRSVTGAVVFDWFGFGVWRGRA